MCPPPPSIRSRPVSASWLAAQTSTLRFVTGVYLLPMRDPFTAAKDRGVTGFVNVPWYYQGTPASSFEWKRAAMERLVEELMVPLQDG
jgi:hypothetical protein